MENKVYQNQIVYYGETRGAISNVEEESVDIHFEDGRYILGLVTDVLFKNAVWTVQNKKLDFSDLNKFVEESQKICSKYTVLLDNNGERLLKTYLGENVSQVQGFLRSQGVEIMSLYKCRDQLFKDVVPVVPKYEAQ